MSWTKPVINPGDLIMLPATTPAIRTYATNVNVLDGSWFLTFKDETRAFLVVAVPCSERYDHRVLVTVLTPIGMRLAWSCDLRWRLRRQVGGLASS